MSIPIEVYLFNFFGLFGVNRVLSLCIQDISKKKSKSSVHNNYNIQDRAKRKPLFFLLKNYLTHFCPTSTMMAYLQLKLISIDTLFIPIDGTLILITCWQFHVILTPFSSASALPLNWQIGVTQMLKSIQEMGRCKTHAFMTYICQQQIKVLPKLFRYNHLNSLVFQFSFVEHLIPDKGIHSETTTAIPIYNSMERFS